MGYPYVGCCGTAISGRLYLGLFLSSIGDGVAVVSVPWLALEIHGSVNRALAVAAAGTAAFLPGIPISFIAGLRRWPLRSRGIILFDSALRGSFFVLIGVLALGHEVTLGPYIGMLAVSSLTRALAAGARSTLIDELIRPEQRLAANSLLSMCIRAGWTCSGRPPAGC